MNESTHAPGLGATVREALRGWKQELTAIPIGRAVVLLAVPMVLESLFAVVDIFFVSKLGSDAVATVELTESLLSPIYALAMGLGAAATAIIARRTGERDLDAAATAAVHVVLAAIVGAALLGVASRSRSRTCSRASWVWPRGVFVSISIAAAYSLQAVVADLLFRRGRWKTITVE